MIKEPSSDWTPLPQADPRANYLTHRAEIDQAIQRVLEGGHYILGDEVAAFEREFADYLGVRHAIGVGSGTDALLLALRACGIGPGDIVITVSHTAVATVAAIELAGANPLFVDINPTSFTLEPIRLEDTIRQATERPAEAARRPRAIVPVHLYGHPADMPAITEIAARYELSVIEDCAQSHGAAADGKKTGGWGHLAAFSFYPTKNLGALGDGGAVATNDPDLAEKVRLLREYGWRQRYISSMPGMNSRLDELQAAVLRVKLRYLDEENERRREIACLYDTLLSTTRLILPRSLDGASHVYHQYVVRDAHRDDLKGTLEAHGIGTLVHYPVPIHLQPAYRNRCLLGRQGLGHTEQACREVLSLPMYPGMTDEQTRRVSQLIVRRDRS